VKLVFASFCAIVARIDQPPSLLVDDDVAMELSADPKSCDASAAIALKSQNPSTVLDSHSRNCVSRTTSVAWP